MPRYLMRYTDYCRRNNYYVDHVIQKWLLVALMVLEMLSIGIAVWALYSALQGVIDANTYRVHFREDANTLPAFFAIGLKIIIGIGIMNFSAIVAADRIWALYVNRILRDLDRIVQSVKRFDFTVLDVERVDHAVIDRAAGWREDEAARLRAIREALASLPSELPVDPAEGVRAAAALRELEACLQHG